MANESPIKAVELTFWYDDEDDPQSKPEYVALDGQEYRGLHNILAYIVLTDGVPNGLKMAAINLRNRIDERDR